MAESTNLTVEDCTFRGRSGRGVNHLVREDVTDVFRNCAFEDAPLSIRKSGMYLDVPMELVVADCTFAGDNAFLYCGFDYADVTTYDMDPWLSPDVRGRIEGNTFSGAGAGAVLHHGLYARLFGENVVEDDARLFAMYITYLMVVPPDGHPPRPQYYAVVHERYRDDLPFRLRRWGSLDGEMFLDVTDDTTEEGEPPIAPLILRSDRSNYWVVRGFHSIDPLAHNFEVSYLDLPHFAGLTEEHIGDLPWKDA
jgi:hypothetical protein